MGRVINWPGHLSPEGIDAASLPSKLTVELFGERDLDRVLHIEQRAHRGHWRRHHFLDSLKASHHHCLGVRHEGQWLAYAVVSCVAREAELLLLVVDVPWQRQGLARALLNYLAAALAPHADEMFLEVRAGNDAAIALYESADFHQVGLRPAYYQSGGESEDALIYARVLDDS